MRPNVLGPHRSAPAGGEPREPGAAGTSHPAPPRRIGSAPRRRRSDRGVARFLLPTLVILLTFRVVPIGYGFWLSFTEWNGYTEPTFIGLANYTRLLDDPTVMEALRNNLVILATVPLWIVIPLVIAASLQNGNRFARLLKLLYLLPTLLSPALLGLMFVLLLGGDGPVNGLLRSIGLEAITTEWLADPRTVLAAFIAVLIWGAFGTGVLYFSSGLASIDPSLYEAARIDGAGAATQFRHVTVPHLRPIIEFWTVIVLIATFTATFPLLFTMTGGGPGRSTTTIDLLIYQTAFGSQDPSYASALAMVAFVIVLVLVLGHLAVMRRRDREG